ncbi:hypothetical protein [Roseomonas haemaphysalidis]|uniref:DUF2188 domain-containing protein n=1 Tax=Roseomonas haemaphysalidis TaxID=2768162 RepID=A0ABS3KKB0_9PROT|nr:hypothetical protein [Roseomonas haemaphysalidis]MBO1077903.1 hypothetical protein [Roseomonas haemaphysalidis]
MAYVELSYYRDCALELREYGDAGWAVHIYDPSLRPQARKIGVVTTTQAAALPGVMAEARAAVDAHLGPAAPLDLPMQRAAATPRAGQTAAR